MKNILNIIKRKWQLVSATLSILVCWLIIALNNYYNIFDKTLIGTLCGSIIGITSVIITNDLNNSFQDKKSKENNNSKKEKIKKLLIAEIVSIFIPIIGKYLIINKGLSYSRNNDSLIVNSFFPFYLNLDNTYKIAIPTVYNKLIEQLTYLEKEEIEAIVNLYDNLSKTRNYIDECINTNRTLNLYMADQLSLMLKGDLENASDVVKFIAENRKIELINKKQVLFHELLRNPHLMNS